MLFVRVAGLWLALSSRWDADGGGGGCGSESEAAHLALAFLSFHLPVEMLSYRQRLNQCSRFAGSVLLTKCRRRTVNCGRYGGTPDDSLPRCVLSRRRFAFWPAHQRKPSQCSRRQFTFLYLTVSLILNLTKQYQTAFSS